jgi:phosphoenolpyruvate synthase/pyruvate phosphate dikinase
MKNGRCQDWFHWLSAHLFSSDPKNQSNSKEELYSLSFNFISKLAKAIKNEWRKQKHFKEIQKLNSDTLIKKFAEDDEITQTISLQSRIHLNKIRFHNISQQINC